MTDTTPAAAALLKIVDDLRALYPDAYLLISIGSLPRERLAEIGTPERRVAPIRDGFTAWDSVELPADHATITLASRHTRITLADAERILRATATE